jgi:tetraacyldisaccharide 4'-kinase
MLSGLTRTLTDYHQDSAAGRSVPAGLSALFWLVAVLYHAARAAKFGLYRFFIRPERLPCRILSVGNITLGGSGKTPLVAWIAKSLCREGLKVTILSRGYGIDARAAGPAGLPGLSGRYVAKGGRQEVGARQGGDEAVLLSRLAPRADVLVGKRRFLTGRRACRDGAQVLVLDDGFQYWRLHRDLDVLLMDLPLNPNRLRLFPFGVLREPLTRLSAAHLIVLTGADRASPAEMEVATNQIARWAPAVPTVLASYIPLGLRPVAGGEALPPEYLKGRRVLAMAGLGRPEGFFASLRALGAQVYGVPFPDHHAYQVQEIEHQLRVARAWGAEALVMTAKDEVNLPAGYRPDFSALVLDVEMQLDPDGQATLRELLRRITSLSR